MALADDVWGEVNEILNTEIEVIDGRTIPDLSEIPFANRGKRIQLHALFIDIRKSTKLVDTLGVNASAMIYKAYLRGVARVVNDRDGELLSFNGDGIVAGFTGSNAANAAILTGLNLNWVCNNILKPRIDATLAARGSLLRFDWGIGVDVGEVVVVKGGMRDDARSDLVWAGTPVNHAVKISAQASYPFTLYVSDEVYQLAAPQLRADTTQGYWEPRQWQEKDRLLWRSNWWFGADYLSPVPTTPVGLRAGYLRTLLPQTMADLARPAVGITTPAMRGLLDAFWREGEETR